MNMYIYIYEPCYVSIIFNPFEFQICSYMHCMFYHRWSVFADTYHPALPSLQAKDPARRRCLPVWAPANKAIYGGVHRWSITQNGWFTMEILLNIDDLGAPQFMETTISKRIIGTQIRWNQSWCPPKLMSISNMPQPSTCFQHLSVLRPAYDLAEEAEDPNSTRAQAHANPKNLRNFSY